MPDRGDLNFDARLRSSQCKSAIQWSLNIAQNNWFIFCQWGQWDLRYLFSSKFCLIVYLWYHWIQYCVTSDSNMADYVIIDKLMLQWPWSMVINSLWPSEVIQLGIWINIGSGAPWHQAITWTNINLLWIRSCDIHLWPISQEMLKILIHKMSLKMHK